MPTASSSMLNAMPNTSRGNSTVSSNPRPGRPETVAIPVAMLAIAPTSCGASRGVNLSRACAMPANVLSKTCCKLSAGMRDLTFHDFGHTLLERSEIVDDAPGQFLPIAGEFDTGNQFRRCLE